MVFVCFYRLYVVRYCESGVAGARDGLVGGAVRRPLVLELSCTVGHVGVFGSFVRACRHECCVFRYPWVAIGCVEVGYFCLFASFWGGSGVVSWVFVRVGGVRSFFACLLIVGYVSVYMWEGYSGLGVYALYELRVNRCRFFDSSGIR